MDGQLFKLSDALKSQIRSRVVMMVRNHEETDYVDIDNFVNDLDNGWVEMIDRLQAQLLDCVNTANRPIIMEIPK